VPEVIEDGVSGFLHPPDAVDEMAASALRLLRDPDLHARMAAAAVRRVCDKFAAEQIVPMYEAAYERLLAARV
jgi:glycosyltransferase involved in cell wall biosynthesis